MNERHPVIGELRTYLVSEKLRTGFRIFSSDTGVGGLAKVKDGELHILAVHASTEGIGQFREFIRQAKEHYRFIRFWTMMNDVLCKTLTRYGFYGGHDTDEFGEMQSVYDWRKP